MSPRAQFVNNAYSNNKLGECKSPPRQAPSSIHSKFSGNSPALHFLRVIFHCGLTALTSDFYYIIESVSPTVIVTFLSARNYVDLFIQDHRADIA